MKRNHKKSLLLLIAAAVVMMACVGVSVAYLVADTDPVTNSFTPAEVTTTTDEEFSDHVTKKNVKVTNTGNVTVYVRACVVANWCDADGNIVAPWTDNINYNTTNWKQLSDGYRYYIGTVKPGASTANLFDSYSYSPSDIPAGADHLVMNVMHQSVQAEPEDAIKGLWGEAALNAVKGQ